MWEGHVSPGPKWFQITHKTVPIMLSNSAFPQHKKLHHDDKLSVSMGQQKSGKGGTIALCTVQGNQAFYEYALKPLKLNF